MAVYSCPEITISFPKGKEKDVLTRIQHLGTIELIEEKEAGELPKEFVDVEGQIMSQLEVVNKAVDALTPFLPKQGKLAFLADSRVIVSPDAFADYSAQKNELFNVAEATASLHKEEVVLKDEIASLEQTLHTVTPFKDVDVKIFGSFAYTAFVPFFVHESRVDMVTSEIARRFSDAVVESIDKVGEDYVFVAAVAKEQRSQLVSYLVDVATLITVDASISGSFHDAFTYATKRLEVAQARIQEIHTALEESSKEIEKMYVLKDVLHSELNRIFAYHSMKEVSDAIVQITGFVDPSRAEETVNALSEIKDVSASVSMEADPNKVVMKNNWFVKPFQIVTQMMGTPLGNAMDPTPYVAGFFIFMYGLALSEAGYGLVCAILTGVLLLVVKNMKSGPKSLFTIIFYASISTIVIGSIFGSWFGITPWDIKTATPEIYLPHTQFLINIGVWPFLQKMQLFNPLQQILTLMIAMGALGIVHLMVGLVFGVRQSMKRGELLEGLLQSGSWLGLMILSILTVLNSMGFLGTALQGSSVLMYILLAYAFLMIPVVGRESKSIFGKFAKGAFDMFFGAISYVSDILSYTRLVALGLATGIIAAVVDTLATLAGGGLAASGGVKMIIGYLIMIVIFVGGHTFNIGLNVLGSYITVGRLHFVEFFGKFFESGAQELKPFAPSEEYIRLTSK